MPNSGLEYSIDKCKYDSGLRNVFFFLFKFILFLKSFIFQFRETIWKVNSSCVCSIRNCMPNIVRKPLVVLELCRKNNKNGNRYCKKKARSAFGFDPSCKDEQTDIYIKNIYIYFFCQLQTFPQKQFTLFNHFPGVVRAITRKTLSSYIYIYIYKYCVYINLCINAEFKEPIVSFAYF